MLFRKTSVTLIGERYRASWFRGTRNYEALYRYEDNSEIPNNSRLFVVVVPLDLGDEHSHNIIIDIVDDAVMGCGMP